MSLFPDLKTYIDQFDFESIATARRAFLIETAKDLSSSYQETKKLELMFICTHNSRRSHLSQSWAAAGAAYYRIDGLSAFSAGTEATAFNRRAVQALMNAGFKITNDNQLDNPKYQIQYGTSQVASLTAFSKVISHPSNPRKDFFAFMTCSEADSDCPVVAGAVKKYPLHYRDPKEADGTPGEELRYAERCLQIGTEMFFLMSRLSQNLENA